MATATQVNKMIEPSLRKQLEGLQKYAHEKTHHKVVEIFSPMSRGKLLEMPTGSGALAWRLHELGFEVVPADLYPESFQVPFLKCSYVDLNAEFSFGDSEFDYVCCVEGIEHLEDHFHFVRQCRRVLRKGGKLVITTPNILNIASRLKYLLSGFWSLVPRPINEFSSNPVDDHINPLTYFQLRYMLHTNGFKIREVTTDLRRRSGWALMFLYPFVRWNMKRTMRKETDPQQIAANKEIRQVMGSLDIFLGRTLVVVAERTS